MTIALGSLTAVLGIVMIVATVARGGAATALGIIVGVAFALIGSGRVYLAVGARSHRGAP